MSEIKKLDSRIVYQNNWMTVTEDKTVRESGTHGIYGVVHKLDFVVVVPIQDQFIYLVEQYRYPVQGRYWELPQGSWEDKPGADPLAVAAGELKEETGLTANKIDHVGHLFQAYGYCSQGYHVYLATGLVEGASDLDAEEEDLISRRFTIADFEQMLVSGEIKDGTTTSVYGLLKVKGIL